MLHKAAHSFSPFKLQHLHSHIRSALNLNLGQNAGQNFNQASTSAAAASGSSAGAAPSSSSSALGGPAAQAGGAGGNAKYHAGRSYGHYHFYNRTTTPAANAASGTDGPSIQKQAFEDEEESSKVLSHTGRNLRWRSGREFAGRQRSSSLSNPGLTTGLPLDSSSAGLDFSSLPRSSPYSFNQAQLRARYRHAFSQAKRPSHERLLTCQPESSLSSSSSTAKRSISTTAIPRKATGNLSKPSSAQVPQTAPSSPRTLSRQLPAQQTRRKSTSTTDRPPAIDEDVIKAASTLTEPPQKTISPEQPVASAVTNESISSATTAPPAEQEDDSFVSITNEELVKAQATEQPTEEEKAFQRTLSQLGVYQDIDQIRSFLRDYRSDKSKWTPIKHMHVIRQLSSLRTYTDTTDEIITFYNDFFENDMVPSLPAVSTAINAYVDRSEATYLQMRKAQLKNNAIKLASAAENWTQGTPHSAQDQKSATAELQSALTAESALATLKQESDEDYVAAVRMLTGLGEEVKYLSAFALNGVLAGAAVRGDIDTALIAFGALEGNPRTEKSLLTHRTFKNLILAYGRGGDPRGLSTIVETYIKSPHALQHSRNRRVRKSTSAITLLTSEEATSTVDKDLADDVIQETGSLTVARDTEIDVCNAAILAYLLVGDGVKALDVLENMMTQKNSKLPSPNTSTLLNLVQGFAESGDLDSAFRWANRIHAQPTPEDLPTPPTLESTLNAIIATTSDIDAVQEAAGKTLLLPKLGEHVRSLASAGQPSTAPSENAPSSPVSSGGNVTDLGSIFSDPAMSTRTMSITPPPYIQRTTGNEIRIDQRLSSTIDDKIRMIRTSPEETKWLYKLISDNVQKGVFAHPEALARAAHAIGQNNGSPEELENVYQWANQALAGLESQSDQAAAWAYLEDRMLMARARRGELQKAAMHRDRILSAGAAPSADAYAVMITSAKDTTDDATVALELFEEARRFGVVPNLYLFNILISKLSKARRTQLALSYFEQMKAVRIRPSAVTYGSVIAACCRTGDEKAATFLFNEMVRSPGYRPRVPPYNTMMQFFITTKPDREKALMYFDAMLKAGVAPTAHTYKLLLDAYGSLEPVDLDSVKDVFSRLLSDPNISYANGGHWASLLHAYGTVKKDLGKTLEIFDSIATHPASVDAAHDLPDVICYEALFNALIAMERIDLVEKYLARMQGQFVKPTAYIWNVIIRAYTVTGDITKAREAFEGLADPPSGVAAAGNHSKEKTDDVASDASSSLQDASSSADWPVYREPSTYEAMIKAEMSIGDPEKAQELLQRAVARAFPAAIINKLERMTKGEDVGQPAFAPSTTQAVGA